MDKLPILEAVTERDIDLLLVEEFHASEAFTQAFVSSALGHDAMRVEFLGAWHSVSESSFGETDVVLMVRTPTSSRHALLIENKVDAPFQPDQASRYSVRGDLGVERGAWETFTTVILAPKRYLDSQSPAASFQAKISYEQLTHWLHTGQRESARSEYRVKLLAMAIEQNRRGYSPKVDERVSRFFRGYWQVASREFPELEMREPKDRPAGSTWAEFKPRGLEKGRHLRHKIEVGRVDLEIAGAGSDVVQLQARHQALLPDDTEIVAAAKSAALRIQVPVVDCLGDFDDQIDKARAGMRAAYRLLYFSRIIPVA